MSNDNLSEDSLFTAEKISILLVDDNKINQFLGKQILSNIGYTKVKVAGSGHAALKLINEQDFDILLTDVEMPGMTGYELTTAVRQLTTSKNKITIIALTANSSKEERKHALELGMDDYLSKPYTPEDLQSVLKKHVKLKDNFFIAEFGATKSNSYSPMSSLYALFNGNKEDVRMLLVLLKQQIPECMEQLKKAIINSQWSDAFNAAHKLKSTVKLFNIDSLFIKASGIAEHARNKTEVHLIPGFYDELHAELQGILAMINKELEEIQ